MKSLILLLVLASVTMTGCIIWEEEVEVPQNETPPPPPPPPNPTLMISSPGEGEVVMVPAGEPGEITLVMSTQNLRLKPPGGKKQVGEGHFKITVAGQSETVASKMYVVSGLAPGEYTAEVEILHNDGSSYVPRIRKTVSFSIQEEEPEVYEPQEHTVAIKDFEYDPEEITVKVSDKVTWVNEGSFPRSATCFIGGTQVFDTGVLGAGASKTITMEKAFECEYYATTHRAMTGKITVEPSE